MKILEVYTPIALGANEVRRVPNANIPGFICVTGGTITVTAAPDTNVGPTVTVLNTFPVTAGSIYGIALFLGTNGGTVTLAGGASGTLLVS